MLKHFFLESSRSHYKRSFYQEFLIIKFSESNGIEIYKVNNTNYTNGGRKASKLM